MVKPIFKPHKRQGNFSPNAKYVYSGPDYLKRVCKKQQGEDAVKILTASKVNAYMLEVREVNSWMIGVRDYLLQVNGELIQERKLVFFIDTQVFLTNTDPKRAVSVMVSITQGIYSTSHRSFSIKNICFTKVIHLVHLSYR